MNRKTLARPPALSDVARVAGVSHQTVSRVINNHPSVKAETRERVQAAISQLGYRRNHAARTLVTNRSGLLAVITVGSFLYGPTSTLVAIEQAAREHGYQVLISSLQHGDPTGFTRAIDASLDQGVETIIVVASHESLVHLAEQLDVSVPLILVGCRPHVSSSLVSLAVDQMLGGRIAAEHLIDLGHREFVHITGPLEWIDARERLQGWQAACDEKGIDGSRIRIGDWSAESGYAAGKFIARQRPMPTAVFAANDNMALGLLRAMHEEGIRVPDKVSIIGFDDIPGASNFLPPLTTVRQDFTALGHRVVGAILTMISGGEPDLTAIPPTLTVRQTTAEPPSN